MGSSNFNTTASMAAQAIRIGAIKAVALVIASIISRTDAFVDEACTVC